MINRFRVWDKDEGKYVKDVSSLMLSIGDTDDGDFQLNSLCPGRYIIEQDTGLKDKNGKMIKEGDIVRYSFTNPNRTYIEPVSFGPIQEGEGYFHQEFLAWRTTYADDGTDHSSLLDLVEPNWTCEIIGNIHESNMEELCPKE